MQREEFDESRFQARVLSIWRVVKMIVGLIGPGIYLGHYTRALNNGRHDIKLFQGFESGYLNGNGGKPHPICSNWYEEGRKEKGTLEQNLVSGKTNVY